MNRKILFVTGPLLLAAFFSQRSALAEERGPSRVVYSAYELYGLRPQRTFTSDHLKEVAFPLGGIGTGTVSLGGCGNLRDWEIFNRPGKGNDLPFTFFALYFEQEGKKSLVRVLEGPLSPPFTAGFGFRREAVPGLPRMEKAVFKGEYPFADVEMTDSRIPLEIVLEAFNPFIPLKPEESGIPAVMLCFRVRNLGAVPAKVGDTEFLKKVWPQVKKALEYAWVQWDADKDGLMEGEQHNTYDIEFFGPNSMMGSFYLGALLAGSKMAEAVGDKAAAAGYRDLHENSRKKFNELLWNGEYYVQKFDQVMEKKYQYGEGRLSDQLLGQWLGMVAGLGRYLPQDRVRSTLRSIFDHNFLADFRDLSNAQRTYALGDEKGLLLCSWPMGGRPPFRLFLFGARVETRIRPDGLPRGFPDVLDHGRGLGDIFSAVG